MRPDVTGQAHSAHTARVGSSGSVLVPFEVRPTLLRPFVWVGRKTPSVEVGVFGGTKTEPPKEAYNYAAEIKLRAERRLGEILKDAPKNRGSAGAAKGRDFSGNTVLVSPENTTPTLAESGLTLKQSTENSRHAL